MRQFIRDVFEFLDSIPARHDVVPRRGSANTRVNLRSIPQVVRGVLEERQEFVVLRQKKAQERVQGPSISPHSRYRYNHATPGLFRRTDKNSGLSHEGLVAWISWTIGRALRNRVNTMRGPEFQESGDCGIAQLGVNAGRHAECVVRQRLLRPKGAVIKLRTVL